jgi:hypothetical protein
MREWLELPLKHGANFTKGVAQTLLATAATMREPNLLDTTTRLGFLERSTGYAEAARR